MASRYAHTREFEGVYYYDSTKKQFGDGPDRCYVITFKAAGRKVWETAGWKSSGVTPQSAAAFRAARLLDIRLGGRAASAEQRREEALKCNRTVAEIFSIYFAVRGAALKGYTTDKNRYHKHIEPILGKRRVSEVSPLSLDELTRAMAGKAEATRRNALELFRRVMNFGAKAGLCPSLPFSIAMPGRL